MKILSELNSQISSNKLKYLLIATPIVVGTGVGLYYYYRNSAAQTTKSSSKSKKIVAKPANDPLSKALEIKNKGNDYFRQGKYEEALKLYSDAVTICPAEKTKELATFYQNRAACYEHLQQYEDVVNDCSKAIENDKFYIKAYLRRGKANEILQRFEDASFDFYVASCSSQFQNSDYIKLLYEVLEKFSYSKARDVIGKRKSYAFQKYLFRHIINKFSRDPLKSRSDNLMNDYNDIVNNLLKDDSNDEGLSIEDLLLKGTIEMYIGKHESGEIKLRRIISIADDNNYKINALVKLAEFCFQNNKLEDAERCLKEAEEIDATNPDLYYIRSQLHIINKSYEAAINDLNKSIELEPNFACAIGQKLYIEYQQLLMMNDFIKKNRVLKEFEQAVGRFPNSNELLLLYFQILLSNNESKKAESFIIKALENDSEDPTLYVYRALVYIEEGELEKTREYLDLALKIDSKCSFAYEMLADLCSKLENLKDALSYLESAINCSTTFEDVKNLILKHKTLELQIKAPTFS